MASSRHPAPGDPNAKRARRRRWPALSAALLVVAAIASVGIVVSTPRHGYAVLRQGKVTATDGVPAYFGVSTRTTKITIVAVGGSGEDGQSLGASPGGRGGTGERVVATFRYGHGISAGDLLELVGEKGPLRGGAGGRHAVFDGSGGGAGGAASGVRNVSTGKWLVVAAGGGGGSGVGLFASRGAHGGNASQPGADARASGGGQGGALGGTCSDASSIATPGGAGGDGRAGSTNGGGGGGGGGCRGGDGGAAGGVAWSGGGGAGGRSYVAHGASEASFASAPPGHASIELVYEFYTEQQPTIVSPDRFDLVVGSPVHADVVADATTPPDVHVKGTFPEGVTFRVPLFSGRGELRGTPAPGSVGTYTIRVTMRNDFGDDAQTIQLVVHPPPAPA